MDILRQKEEMTKKSFSQAEAADKLLDGLNPEQMKAVKHKDGPLLILAGAGSGKTRVITHRIAYMVQSGAVYPANILAITFTNKAAAEMKERIEALMGTAISSMWVGTFHSMLLRILRKYAVRLGFTAQLTILDSDDQQRIIKQCYKELDLDDKRYPVRSVHARISKAKNDLISVEQFTSEAGQDFMASKIAAVYKLYQQKLRQNNSMDFDDILFEAVKLLEENKEVLQECQQKFRYIMVDEYQDTNQAQYRLVYMLAAAHRNLCVVGDDDQSIYSFRGANIENILNFEKDFPDCTTIKLEQNYRSTNNVLQAANAVIKNNRGRKAKRLRTNLPDGDLITFYRNEDQHAEARYVAGEISRYASNPRNQKPYGQTAILYRLNALSRNMEFALREQGIPYRIFGGTRFYDRKEIKDVLAYLRLILVPEDRLSFERIINTPRRGVGDVTLAAINEIAVRTGQAPLEVCRQAADYPQLLRASSRLLSFYELIERLRQQMLSGQLTLAELIEKVEDESGLIQEIVDSQEKSGKSDSIDRIENLKEMLSDAVEFSASFQAETADSLASLTNIENADNNAVRENITKAEKTENDTQVQLTAYLERATLYADLDDDKDQDYVRLMTIHSAKGLEFTNVFLIGAEEGLFPGYRSMDSEAAIEEERRLAYVAITRAKTKLYITAAKTRLIFGQTQAFRVSPFIREIPDQYIEEVGGPRAGRSQARYDGSFRTGTVGGSGFRKEFPGAPSRTQADAPSSLWRGRAGTQGVVQATTSQGLDPAKLKKGLKVKHPKFGLGKVEQITPVANDAIIVVAFEQYGLKRMMATTAPLQIH